MCRLLLFIQHRPLREVNGADGWELQSGGGGDQSVDIHLKNGTLEQFGGA